MSNLVNFFFSFEKLMKEKLVITFFWLAVIRLALVFAEDVFDSIGLDPIGWLFGFGGFFVEFLLLLVAVRVLCEIAIAIFRINDNLAPDGGKSETADIDPIKEALKAAEDAKKAAEEAAKKATAATKSAVNRTKAESSKDEKVVDVEIIEPEAEPATKPKPAAASKAPAKKTTAKKPAAKKTTTARKTTTKKSTAAKKPAAKKTSSAKEDKPTPETD